MISNPRRFVTIVIFKCIFFRENHYFHFSVALVLYRNILDYTFILIKAFKPTELNELSIDPKPTYEYFFKRIKQNENEDCCFCYE